MKDFQKLLKIQRALTNAISSKNGTTDILFHMQKEFPEYKNIKKFFDDTFDKEFLIDEKIIDVNKSEADKRVIEYKLTSLNTLYEKLVNLCLGVSEIDCKSVIKTFISQNILYKLFDAVEYDILETMEKEIKSTIFPKKSKEKDIYEFISPASPDIDIVQLFISSAFKEIKNSINPERLNNEILFLEKTVKNIFLLLD